MPALLLPPNVRKRFSVHGIHMPVPDGTPCWHPSEPNGQRTGAEMWVFSACQHLHRDQPLQFKQVSDAPIRKK